MTSLFASRKHAQFLTPPELGDLSRRPSHFIYMLFFVTCCEWWMMAFLCFVGRWRRLAVLRVRTKGVPSWNVSCWCDAQWCGSAATAKETQISLAFSAKEHGARVTCFHLLPVRRSIILCV